MKNQINCLHNKVINMRSNDSSYFQNEYLLICNSKICTTLQLSIIQSEQIYICAGEVVLNNCLTFLCTISISILCVLTKMCNALFRRS